MVGSGGGPRRPSRCCAASGGRLMPIKIPVTSKSTPITTFFDIDSPNRVSIDCETVEKTRAAGRAEVLLAAAARRVCGVPRTLARILPHAIEVADLRAATAARGPVRTGEIAGTRVRRPVGTRTRQDVVILELDHLTAFCDAVFDVDLVARVGVQLLHVDRDPVAERVVPRALADAIARVDGWRRARRHRAEIRAPGVIAGALGLRERLTVCVRAGKPAEIAAPAKPATGDEEARH